MENNVETDEQRIARIGRQNYVDLDDGRWLIKKLRSATEDTARLDWLDTKTPAHLFLQVYSQCGRGLVEIIGPIREAIDAARKSESANEQGASEDSTPEGKQ